MSSSEAKLIYQKYDEMLELLRGYREKIYQQWVAGVDQDCHFNLGQPLIRRDPVTNLVQVNFSKAVGAVPPLGPEGVPCQGAPRGPGPHGRWGGGRSPKPGPLLPKQTCGG